MFDTKVRSLEQVNQAATAKSVAAQDRQDSDPGGTVHRLPPFRRHGIVRSRLRPLALCTVMPNPDHFFSCDWGTTSFRLRLVDAESLRVVAEAESPAGARDIAASLPPGVSVTDRATAFAQVLASQLTALPGAQSAVASGSPVIVSGMASSSIGWRELPYAQLPFSVDGSQAQAEWLSVEAFDGALPVLLVSGVAADNEMMRGEEAQVIGLLEAPRFAGCAADSIVLLPGTHSKHIRVVDGSVTGLQTFMTGELYDILGRHSVLRFTTDAPADAFDDTAFCEGVEAARSNGLARSLFQVRTRGVLRGLDATANRSFLGGLLVGTELGAVPDERFPLLLAATGAVGRFYELAASCLGLSGRLAVAGAADLKQAVIAGHARLWKMFTPHE